MQNRLDNICNRMWKKENKEKYHYLIFHPTDVEGGEQQLLRIDNMKEIIETYPKKDSLRQELLKADFLSKEKECKKWLDENGWS